LKGKIAGKEKQWEAEITEQVPDKRIAWASVDRTPNTGEVTFEFVESERTLITLMMEYVDSTTGAVRQKGAQSVETAN
jgi:uncharacterized membrane protein